MKQCVVVVDDNRDVLVGVATLLRRRGFQAWPFASLEDATDALECDGPRLCAALIDVWFRGGRTGFEIASQLRAHFSERLPLAMMTAHKRGEFDIDTLVDKFSATFLCKPLNMDDLNMFLCRAALFPLELPLTISETVLAMTSQFALLPNETRILAQLAVGSTRSSLARDLCISPDTLKWQLKRLLSKLQAPDTTELVATFLREFCSRSRAQ
jgi:FixJ family two-component response regulator